jgi:hypothetical protein
LADEALHEFEAVDVAEREVRLDAVLHQPLDVFEVEVGRRVGDHVGHRMEHRRVGEARPGEGIIDRVQRRQIIERGATGNRDLIRLGIDLGQLVARVIALELRLLARLRREGDRPADLQDHPGHGLAEARDLVGVLLEILRNVARLGIAHMDVQQRGSGVEAIDRDLGLLFPGDREFLFGRAIPRQPHWSVGRRGDHQRGLVFRQQRVVGEVHGAFLFLGMRARAISGPSRV